ncbi:MAG: hypothetical protein JW984_06480 [Deltaproteobacteria bacterium]|uniref:Uncharacterized protein n=1 Tax=Candidatus Zymogenus saltonus TaxID=2844893 RepID=A0A9D8KE54_9DELT|nr:hypothetical protein [Candidatus Zymogenus saltonus]
MNDNKTVTDKDRDKLERFREINHWYKTMEDIKGVEAIAVLTDERPDLLIAGVMMREIRIDLDFQKIVEGGGVKNVH